MINYIFNIEFLPRIIFAFICSLVLALSCGGKMIVFLRARQGKGQPIREDGPASHLLNKRGTPTMGGLLILGASIITTLVFAKLNNPFIWIALAVFVIYGFMGFVDDYVKVTKQSSNAMTAKMKLFLQFLTSLVSVLLISHYTSPDLRFELSFPYLQNITINLWYFYVPFAMIVIAGASNAVNLTDGLDGLASGLLICSFIVFLAVAFCILDFKPITFAPEIAVLCAAVIGSLLGFLWFNCSPAQIFMGDTGSLALGGLLGVISIMLKSEILLAIVGLVFVIEAISVMIQITVYKKCNKRRFFLMAPIHHHFEQLGWPETRVVTRFWIIGFILMVVGLLAVMV